MVMDEEKLNNNCEVSENWYLIWYFLIYFQWNIQRLKLLQNATNNMNTINEPAHELWLV